jgi:hypothetical protein
MKKQMGLPREDVLVPPERSHSGFLELHTQKRGHFGEMQAIRYRENLFMITKGEVDRIEENHFHRYYFHPFSQQDVARGKIYELVD